MSFILITADFPGIRSDEMAEIYKRLENGSWQKRHNHNGSSNATWALSLTPGIPQADALRIAQASFMACCSPYCRPVMVMQWGDHQSVHSNVE